MDRRSGPRVVVEDIGVDAAFVDDDEGNPLLILGPHQTFTSAVAAVQKAMPNLHPDAVRRVVRESLPHVTDLPHADGSPQFGLDVAAPAARMGVRLTGKVAWTLAVAAVLAVAGCAVLMVAAVRSTHDRDTQITAPFPLYAGTMFDTLRHHGFRCEATRHDGLTARCDVVTTGMHYDSEAAVGADYIAYTFYSHDSRVVLRQNKDPLDAMLFANDADNAVRYLHRVGRYDIYGGDPALIRLFAAALPVK
jgi:hypothetical protein